MNTIELWNFSSQLKRDAQAPVLEEEERPGFMISVREAIEREFSTETACGGNSFNVNCNFSNGTFVVSVSGLKYPNLLDEVWQRLNRAGEGHQLVPLGVYRASLPKGENIRLLPRR